MAFKLTIAMCQFFDISNNMQICQNNSFIGVQIDHCYIRYRIPCIYTKKKASDVLQIVN